MHKHAYTPTKQHDANNTKDPIQPHSLPTSQIHTETTHQGIHYFDPRTTAKKLTEVSCWLDRTSHRRQMATAYLVSRHIRLQRALQAARRGGPPPVQIRRVRLCTRRTNLPLSGRARRDTARTALVHERFADRRRER